MTSIRETTPPRSIATAITSLAGSTMPVPATVSSYGFAGAAIGGDAARRGSCLAAMDQPAKLTIAIARSGMPCRVGENTRVISSDLRKMSKARGADSVNTAVLHRSDAVGETVDPGIMRHDDDCPVGSARRILEDLEHGLTGIGIQRSSGLVAHDEPGSVDQRAGDGDALLLTAGELVRQFAEMRAHPDTIEDRGSWRCRPRRRHPGRDQRNGRVLGGGQRRQKIVLLEDETDVAAAERDFLGVRHQRERLAARLNLAARRAQDRGDDRDQGRLAAAGRPNQHRQLSGGNLEVDAVQDLDRPVAHREGLRHAAATDGGYWITHCVQPRKTIAGSTTMTLRMLAKLAITMITRMAQAVPAATCHGSSKPRRLIEMREVISKKPAQRPMPIA